MQIKRLTVNDKEIVEKCDKLFVEFLDSEGQYDDNYLKREKINSFLGDLDKENNILLCCVKEDVMAFLYGYIEKRQGMKDSVAHITFVYVKEEYRKQNIATTLINEYMRILKEKDISIIEVKAYKNNQAANMLYNKFGFNELWVNYRARI